MLASGCRPGGRLQGGGRFASEPGGWRSLHVGGRSARAAVCYGELAGSVLCRGSLQNGPVPRVAQLRG